MIKFIVETDPDIDSLIMRLEGDVSSAVKFGLGHLSEKINRHNSAGKPSVGRAVNAYLTGAKKRTTHKGHRPSPFSFAGATDIQAAIQNYLTGAGSFEPSTSCIAGCHAPSPVPSFYSNGPFNNDALADLAVDVIEDILELLFEGESPEIPKAFHRPILPGAGNTPNVPNGS